MLLLRSAFRMPVTPVTPVIARRAAAPASAGPGGACTAARRRYSTDAEPDKYPFPWVHATVGGVSAAAILYYTVTRKKEHEEHEPPKHEDVAPAADRPVECALDPKEFQPYALKSVHDVSHNTKIFSFSLPDATKSLGLPVASCLLTKFNKDDGDMVIRPYTPISTDADKGQFDLLIKVYENGPMSEHVFAMKPGDTLEMKGPLLKIKYEPNRWNKIGMIAGGTGLTPMLQVIKKILSNPDDKTKVSLLFANQEGRDILLKAELDALAKQHPDRFQVQYTLDKPPSGWKGETGFVSKNMVEKYMPGKDENAIIFVCGPAGMVAHVSGSKTPDYQQGEVGGILAALGYTKDKVFKF